MPLNACAWSIQRFPASIGDVAWGGLTDAARRSLQETAAELQARASTKHFPSPDRASLLLQQAHSFGPHAEAAAIDVHPDGVELRDIVWQILGSGRTRTSTAACAASDAVVNPWDYQVELVWRSPE